LLILFEPLISVSRRWSRSQRVLISRAQFWTSAKGMQRHRCTSRCILV